MKIIALVLLSCVLWEAKGYPYYPYYGNVDSLAYGSSDNSRGGMVMSRYYNPYYTNRGLGGGMAAFMYRQPEEPAHHQFQPSQYYNPDRRRQIQQLPQENFPLPQENEVYYPRVPEKPIVTEQTDIAEPTEKTEVISTTSKSIAPEFTEPEIEEIEEPVQKPKKRVSKKKPVPKPVEDEEDDEAPKMPAGAFFPMFFGWGRNAGGGTPGGATAIANAYSTGRGGVATSHATAYGMPTPDTKYFQKL